MGTGSNFLIFATYCILSSMAIAKVLPTYIFDGITLYPPFSKIIIYDSSDAKIIDLVSADTSDFEDLLRIDGLLAPGFVNVHCHLELSHLQGQITKYCGLPKFLLEVITRKQLHSEEEIEIATQKMLDSLEFAYATGTRVIGDIVNTTLSLSVKQNYSGGRLGNFRLHNFIELVGFDAYFPEWKKQQFNQVYTDFMRAGLVSSLALHAPYSVGQDLLTQWAKQRQTVSSIHNQETKAENELYLYGKGDFIEFYQQLGIDYHHFCPPSRTSFQHFLPYMASCSQRSIFVHNTFMRLTDMHYFLQQDKTLRDTCFFAICARANEYIEGQLPLPEIFTELREYLVIGTDSLASNTDLSLFKELQFLQTYYNLSSQDLLFWATANGAKALNVEQEYGYLRRGFRPGIVWIHPIGAEGEFLENSQLENLI